MAVPRSTWVDDDGSGTLGTIVNNAQLQAIYSNIDAESNSLIFPDFLTKTLKDSFRAEHNAAGVHAPGSTRVSTTPLVAALAGRVDADISSGTQAFLRVDNGVAMLPLGVGSANLKLAQGVAAFSIPILATGLTNITLNRLSFFPSVTGAAAQTVTIKAMPGADPGDTTGRFAVMNDGGGAGSGGTGTVRWDYITASNRPTLWVMADPTMGEIRGVWLSDDPTPDGSPGISADGMTSLLVDPADLMVLHEIAAQEGHPIHRLRAAFTDPAKAVMERFKVSSGHLVQP